MKTSFLKSISSLVGFSLALSLNGLAVEAPEDNTPPPVIEQKAAPEVGYLGVVTADIPEVLTAHLGIAKGEGIIVRSVMPDSAAEEAGIKTNDIITHLDGAQTGSPLEFSKLVKEYTAGSPIKLRLIQEGKATQAEATLSKRPDRFKFGAQPLAQLPLDGVPPEIADRMRDMIQGNIQRMEMPPGVAMPQEGDPRLNDAIKELRQKLQEQMEDGPNAEAGIQPNLKQSTTMKMIDENGAIELQSTNGKKELTARNLENDILWSGPWNTDEEKAAAPEEIRERAAKLKMLEIRPGQLNLKVR